MGTRIPLLLLPGSLCDPGTWNAQVSALDDIVDCHVVDLSGHDSVEEMARQVLERAPAGRFALAGFSLGGYVALEIVRMAPHRVCGLALLDTSPRPDPPGNDERRLANIAAFAEDPAPVLGAFAELVLGPDTPAGLADAIRTMMDRRGPGDYAAQQRAMMRRPDARPNLPSVACPTLVLCGKEDRATPPELSRELADGIPDSVYIELPGTGHMTILEAPQEVARAMRDWLFRVVEQVEAV